jgi:hypothetical protein
VAAIGLALAAALLLPGAAAAQDPDEIFIGDAANGVVVHDLTLTGNVAPLRHLDGGSTGFTASTYSVAVDERRREIYVPVATTDLTTAAIRVFDLDADGGAAPKRSIVGLATGLQGPLGVAYDFEHDELFVSDYLQNKILVFARTATGNVAPLRAITPNVAGPLALRGIALDYEANQVAVANLSGVSILFFPRAGAGVLLPTRVIAGAATQLEQPYGLFVDGVHDELIVTHTPSGGSTSGAVVHARTASDNATPLRVLTVARTNTTGVVVSLRHDELLIGSQSGVLVEAYPRTASGVNPAPTRAIQGAATGFGTPTLFALAERVVFADDYESGDPSAWDVLASP